ncbi:hypothetical protein QQ045_019156 [Rhodiola kirilowii]
MAALKALRTMRDRRLGRLPLYEDITPSSRWADGTNGRSFVIDLPGFKKEEVNLEIDESRNVTIKGRHDVGNNRFRRFTMTVKAPEDTEMKKIVGDLEGGLYTVVFPKMMVATAEAVQEDKLGDGGGEETEPEQKKNLDADKGLETVLGTESSKVMENAAEESSKEEAVAVAAVVQAERELVETAEKKPEEAATVLPQSSLRTEENAIQKPESATKPAETAATQELETETNPAQTAAAIQEPKTETRPAETIETNSSSEIPKAVVESPAPKTATTILAQDNGKAAIKDGAHKNEGIKKDGGFLENVMEKINEHKACIMSAILAFSMGILISRKFRK